MRALVVYESMYGSTREIAEAVGDGLRELVDAEVDVRSIHRAGAVDVEHADLVVVGGPTHAHGMSRPSTRRGAVEQRRDDLVMDPEAAGDGVREWLAELGAASRPGRAAAFDTRVHMAPFVTGRASKSIARELRHHGFELLVDPESFLVTKETHLEPGELFRARAWGRRLAELLVASTAPAEG
jgi:hypothetical protein